MKHANIALFVPHIGCPHRCSFCDQNAISGAERPPEPADVTAACETALQSLGSRAAEAEIAFFGGSFTAIDRGYMLRLLDAARPYVRAGKVRGIRLSTRPDAVEPEVLLMDEPTSALDPISTAKVEELALELKKDYTIVMVTHNMQQAARISDRTAFFLLGEIVEFGKTEQIFSMPKDKRTEDYITGRFG